MWRLLAVLAVLWPSRLSGILDGPPLDTAVEALALGLVVPLLAWLHPSFLRHAGARGLIAAILLLKLGAALTLQQEGWCLTFDPPKPMVRESTGKPHAWDIRADWLADDPVCSAVMTRSYRDTRELPVWFFNLTPPDDKPHRAGYGFGEIPVRETLIGFIEVPEDGTFELITGPGDESTLLVDSRPIGAREPDARSDASRAARTSCSWTPSCRASIGRSSRSGTATTWARCDSRPRSWARLRGAIALARPIANWLLFVLCAGLVAWWGVSFLRACTIGAWSRGRCGVDRGDAGRAYPPSQAPWYAAAALALSLLIVFRERFRNFSAPSC